MLKTLFIIFLLVNINIFTNCFQLQSPSLLKKSSSALLVLNLSAEDLTQKSDTFIRKNKKFNIDFHNKLQNHFPDWERRMEYQKNQEEFYKSALKKKRELERLRVLDEREQKRFYTAEQLDAITYFHGTGFYAQQQDPSKDPNIFDTRQTFLLKMHDPVKRRKFLEFYNERFK